MNTKTSVLESVTVPLILLFAFSLPVIFMIDQHLFGGMLAYGGSDGLLWGLLPRSPNSLFGILTHNFLHVSWTHVNTNAITVILFGIWLSGLSNGLALAALGIGLVVPGTMEWFMGDPEVMSVGASVVGTTLEGAFCVALFWLGMNTNRFGLKAFAVLATILIWPDVLELFGMLEHSAANYQGHLLGFFTGAILAVVARRYVTR